MQDVSHSDLLDMDGGANDVEDGLQISGKITDKTHCDKQKIL